MSRRVPASAALAALMAVVLTSCSSTEDDSAREAADGFYAALEATDGTAACDLLTPTTKDELEQSAEKPCDQAILEEDVPAVTEAERVKVYDTMAQVRYAEDTVFLTRIDDSWRVLAVGCTRQPHERPYDCTVTGG
jgi:hypothetical protein